MSETIVKKLRAGMTGMTVIAAISALLGAIGIFVTNGILTEMVNNRLYASSDTTALSIIQTVAWDLLRMGGFGMFVCSLISVIIELFGKASGKIYSFVMLFGSIFGLISAFMLSMSSMINSGLSNIISSYSSSDYSSGFGTYTVAGVFGIVSAVIVFVGLGIRSYQPAPLAYPPQGYPQQYPQGYPQQYPQQGVPQQAYPQQQYPQQGVPQQQYPQQEIPQQSVPVQPQQVDLNKPGDGQNGQ